MKSRQIDILSINIATLLLGVAGLFAKLIPLPAMSIIAGRSLAALPVMIMLCWLTKSLRSPQNMKDALVLLIAGLFMAGHWVLFYQSVQFSSVAIGVICVYTYPLMSAIIEPVFFKYAFNKQHLYSGIAIVVGIFILSGHHLQSGNLILGIGCGLLSALLFALRNVVSKDRLKSYNASWIMCIQVGVTALCLLPFSWPSLARATPYDMSMMAIAGIGISAIAHTLFVQSFRSLTTTTAGIIASFQIVYASLAAWLLLDESLSWNIAIGGAIILSTVVLEQIYVYHKKN